MACTVAVEEVIGEHYDKCVNCIYSKYIQFDINICIKNKYFKPKQFSLDITKR